MSTAAVVALYRGRHISRDHGDNSWVNVATLVVAILSMIAAYGVWFHPISPNEPGFNNSSSGSNAPSQPSASQAVDFALSQIGSPYVYGGAGPYNDGYDSSGLLMTAWEHAGLQIPRDPYGMWIKLPHVQKSALQPGDILFYNDFSHVAMYIGHNDIIDAPRVGMNVEVIPMSTPLYAQNYDGAAQPSYD